MDESLESVLKFSLTRYFGYESFREHQLSVILHMLHGRDAFCLMATGSGKSLLYQLPAIALREKGIRVCSVVISPLISLMEDQVISLKAMGVPAIAIGGGATADEEHQAMKGHYTIIYATPEKAAIWQHGFKELMQSCRVICLAIDESHCVSEWGYDFRPQYRQLGALRQILSSVPCLALSATATAVVQKDILAALHLHKPYRVTCSFDRKNIKYSVYDRSGPNDLLRALLLVQSQHLVTQKDGRPAAEGFESRMESERVRVAGHRIEGYDGRADQDLSSEEWVEAHAPTPMARVPTPVIFQPTLVYVNTKKECASLAKTILDCTRFSPVRVATYHSGLSLAEKKEVAAAFAKDEVQIVVATSAFGMGIHKPNIRCVVHYGITQSIEAYYQQTGRAGRDGLPASCVLLYHRSDDAKSWNIGSTFFGTCPNPSGRSVQGANRQNVSLAPIDDEYGIGAAYEAGIASDAVLQQLADIVAKDDSTRQTTAAKLNQPDSHRHQPNVHPAANNPTAWSTRLQSHLDSVGEYVRGVGGCRRRYLLAHFGEGGMTTEELRKASRFAARPGVGCCDLCDSRGGINSGVGGDGMGSMGARRSGMGSSGANRTGFTRAAYQPDADAAAGAFEIPSSPQELLHSASEQLDLGVEVYLALQTIAETGSGSSDGWGLNIPILVLLGSHEKSVQKLPHYSSLSTFGMGQGRSKDWWKAFVHQLAESEKLLTITYIRGGGGKFTYPHADLSEMGLAWLQQNRPAYVDHFRKLSSTTSTSTTADGDVEKARVQYMMVPSLELGVQMGAASRSVPSVSVVSFTTSAAGRNVNGPSYAPDEEKRADADKGCLGVSDRAARVSACQQAIHSELLTLRNNVSIRTGAMPYNILSTAELERICQECLECRTAEGLLQLGILKDWRSNSFGLEVVTVVDKHVKEAGLSAEDDHRECAGENAATAVAPSAPTVPAETRKKSIPATLTLAPNPAAPSAPLRSSYTHTLYRPAYFRRTASNPDYPAEIAQRSIKRQIDGQFQGELSCAQGISAVDGRSDMLSPMKRVAFDHSVRAREGRPTGCTVVHQTSLTIHGAFLDENRTTNQLQSTELWPASECSSAPSHIILKPPFSKVLA